MANSKFSFKAFCTGGINVIQQYLKPCAAVISVHRTFYFPLVLYFLPVECPGISPSGIGYQQLLFVEYPPPKDKNTQRNKLIVYLSGQRAIQWGVSFSRNIDIAGFNAQFQLSQQFIRNCSAILSGKIFSVVF